MFSAKYFYKSVTKISQFCQKKKKIAKLFTNNERGLALSTRYVGSYFYVNCYPQNKNEKKKDFMFIN